MFKKIGEFFRQYNDVFHKITQPVRNAAASVAEKVGLHRFSDKTLNTVAKWSKGLAIFGGAHAGLWFLFGFAGLAVFGIHAAGIALPLHIGLKTFYAGSLLGMKSVVVSGLLGGLYKRSTTILAERHDRQSKAIQPYIQDNSDLSSIPGIGRPFGMAATPPVGMPEVKKETAPMQQPAAAPKVPHAP